jgi:hypothetical protein
VKQEQEL